MSYAAHVTASLFDQVVAETSATYGKSLDLGGTDALGIPRPAGSKYMARLTWVTPTKLRITDARGEVYTVTKDAPLTLSEGPISLHVSLARRFRLRRLPPMALVMTTTMSTMLLTILILSFSLVPQQVMAVNQTWCATWIGEVAPPESLPFARSFFSRCWPVPPKGGGSGSELGDHLYSNDLVAEYLERILKKEFDGDADGVLERRDRQFGERDSHTIYMPAGDSNSSGDMGEMGGAEEVGLRPIRTESRAEPEPVVVRKPQALVAADDQGTPVDLPQVDPAEVDDERESDPDESVDDDPDTITQRTEDREGWGVKDWYDQEAKQKDNIENDVMQGFAKRILKINPDDPEALAVLAYYQYLDEDLDGAEATYDKYIQGNPEDPAGYNNKALVFKRRGEYVEEERLYHIALSFQPNDYTAKNNLAVNLGHQGRFDEALALLDELKALDPDEPYTDLHRAKVYAEMGEDDRALEFLEKALAGMTVLGTQHAIEFRQDIRVDPSFERLRKSQAFRQLLWKYYGEDSPLPQ